eukprot:408216-Rhodomonas_salina.4
MARLDKRRVNSVVVYARTALAAVTGTAMITNSTGWCASIQSEWGRFSKTPPWSLPGVPQHKHEEEREREGDALKVAR